MTEHIKTVARIYCNRGPSIPIWDVYIPERGPIWRKNGFGLHVGVLATREGAFRWAREQGYEPELGAG